MERKPRPQPTTHAHETVAVVLQVRDGTLQVLLWRRALAPVRRALGAARRPARPGETLEQSIRRHLAAKVDVRELSHLEQLETHADPGSGRVTTAYLGLVRTGLDPAVPGGHALAPGRRACRRPRSTTARSRSPGASACARSSPTRTSASRSRPRRSRSRSSATCTRPRSATRSPRRTSSGCSSAAACSSRPAAQRPPGRAGGRPAAVYRFRLGRPRDHRPVRRAAPAAQAAQAASGSDTNRSAISAAHSRIASPVANVRGRDAVEREAAACRVDRAAEDRQAIGSNGRFARVFPELLLEPRDVGRLVVDRAESEHRDRQAAQRVLEVPARTRGRRGASGHVDPAAEDDAAVRVEIVDLRRRRQRPPGARARAASRRSPPRPRAWSRTSMRTSPESCPSSRLLLDGCLDPRLAAGRSRPSADGRRAEASGTPDADGGGPAPSATRPGPRARAGHERAPSSASGSAVESASCQRRPKRRGGSRKVAGSWWALKRTTNDSSATCSPSRRPRGDLVAVQEQADRAELSARPSRGGSSSGRPGGTTSCPAGPSRAASRR